MTSRGEGTALRRLGAAASRGLLPLCLCLFVIGCERPPDRAELSDNLQLIPVGFEALPGWREDTIAEALPALRRSCGALLRQPDGRDLGADGLAGSVADWRPACEGFLALAPDDEAGLRRQLEADFAAFRAENQNGRPGLFTGYYEPELKGARMPDATHAWPLYRLPDDLVTADLRRFGEESAAGKLIGRVESGRLVPYYDRAEIDAGVLAGRDLELAWVDDPVDAFFLHVQGSGRLRLPDGSVMRVGFAGSNGLPFYAIGRALIEEGYVSRAQSSMQAIRDWLRAHPEQGRALMQRNARFIFFREIEGEGPVGAQGVALTPGRSLAVDTAYLPLGVPLWLDSTWPATERPLRRLMVAQDRGSAIKGPVRGDFFWGPGEAALEQAGRMKQSGTYYLLLPKTVAERRRLTS